MIISIAIENWQSFKKNTKFSMGVNKNLELRREMPRVHEFNNELLPVAAIYGGNASGKSNFVNALSFARSFIVNGALAHKKIPVKPFALEKSYHKKPSKFVFVLYIENSIYKYSFSANSECVLSEELSQTNSKYEKILFKRGKKSFKTDLKRNSKKLNLIWETTWPNELYLSKYASFKLMELKPVYNWFRDTLRIIKPASRFVGFHSNIDSYRDEFDAMLMQLDTGINKLEEEKVTEELPDEVKEFIQRGVTRITLPIGSDRYIFRQNDNDETVVSKLVTGHKDIDGDVIKFDLAQESDGSRRIIDLLPGFFELALENKVYIIDELNRSLHSIVTKNLVNAYLSTIDNNFRSQLILTTHELMLMDQDLFRRDELWVTERNYRGETSLRSIDDFKLRKDKEIKKMYLEGYVGGLPRVIFEKSARNPILVAKENKISGKEKDGT